MSNCHIHFKHFLKEPVIHYQRNKLMGDILRQYVTESGLTLDKFNFFYNEKIINPDETLNQLNDKDTEIQIFVYPKIKQGNEDKTENNEKLNYIKIYDYCEPAIVEFPNDYKIILMDRKNEIKKIKLQEYNRSQMINKNEIKCWNCHKTMAEIYQENFYYCLECKKIFCSKCKSLHIKHKNIIDYSLKYYKCSQHQGEEFISYCLNCKMNLCSFCMNQHKEHNIINFSNLIPDINLNYENIENIREIKELVDNIIISLEKFKRNLDVYSQINEKLNKNFLNKNFNYELLKSMKNLNEVSFLKNDIKQILNKKTINEKFKKIMSIYDIMNKSCDIMNSENINTEINLKINIEQNDIFKYIFF